MVQFFPTIILRSQGYSLDRLGEEVLKEGLVPIDRRPKFRKSLVEKVLKNPFYMGEFDYVGERHQGKHIPIVSRALWEATQETFRARMKPGYRVRHKNGSLAGFMKCACGCQMTYDPKDKPSGRHYDYYRCSNGKRQHAKLVYVSEENIFREFQPALNSVKVTEKRADEIIHALNETEEKALRVHDRYIGDLKARYRESEKMEDTLYDDLRKGVLDDGGYKRQIERVRAERARLADVLNEAQKEVTGAVLVTAKKILELAQKASDMYLRQTPEKRREVLEKILSNPVLDGLSVQYELKKPFQLVAEMASSSNWGGLSDSNR